MTPKQKRIWRNWKKIEAKLPQDPITPEIEQSIVRAVRKLRAAEKKNLKVRTHITHTHKIKSP